MINEEVTELKKEIERLWEKNTRLLNDEAAACDRGNRLARECQDLTAKLKAAEEALASYHASRARDIEKAIDDSRETLQLKAHLPEDGTLVYTVHEVAKALGTCPGTIYKAVRAGKVPTVRVGKRYLIPKSWVMGIWSGKNE